MTEEKNMSKSDLKMPTPQSLLEAGVHFGHNKSRWNPKMEQYIFGVRNGVHILDLEKTLSKMEEALNFMRGVIARGGKILFVGIKPAAKSSIKETAQKLGCPYVYERWIGGTLTNFKTFSQRQRYMKDMEQQQTNGGWDKFTKKERLELSRKLEKLQGQLEGIRDLNKIPEAMFIADLKADELALKEAKITGVPVIGICDTINDPSLVDYPIPANDDAVSSIKAVMEAVYENLKDVKPQIVVEAKKEDSKKTK